VLTDTFSDPNDSDFGGSGDNGFYVSGGYTPFPDSYFMRGKVAHVAVYAVSLTSADALAHAQALGLA
jgi:hypothetical protein